MRQKVLLQPFLVSRDILFLRWVKRCRFNQFGFAHADKLNIHQIFVRAFDLDERLVGVAFMDVGVYVTSLRTLKNFLLVGDAVKSVMFVAFQVRWAQWNANPLLHICSIGRPIQACPFSKRYETSVCHKCRFLFHKWRIIICNGWRGRDNSSLRV